MEFFLNEILEDQELKRILSEETARRSQGESIAKGIIETGTVPEMKAGILPVFVLAYLSEYALAKNLERGITEEITIATLKDINVWLDNYRSQHGVAGLGEFHWLIHHYTADLFRLGRLQFRIEKSLCGVPLGEYSIETHIPQGEPLDIDRCLKSFTLAKHFFKAHFPEYAPTYFTCDSWLLNPNLAKVLSEDSNIVRFMKLWTRIPFENDASAQAIERIFGFGYTIDDISVFPENTRLQKRVKEFLLNGGTLDITAGYRKI